MSVVSVIVTCFNQEETIGRTIDSVLCQTHSELECIVIDDGSTDRSRATIDKLVRADSRVRYYWHPNMGVTKSRNRGFERAEGEYIQFLDGDDLLSPDKLLLQLQHFRADAGIDVSYSNFQYLNLDSGVCSTYPYQPLAEYPLEQLLFQWFDGYHLPVHTPLFRRSIWNPEDLPYPEDYPHRCEDWVFLIRVAMKQVRFSYLDKVLCTYCLGRENFTYSSKAWNIAAILAAAYLESRIPLAYQDRFLKDVVSRTLDRYHLSLKAEVLQASMNWQLGNFFTRPIIQFKRLLLRR